MKITRAKYNAVKGSLRDNSQRQVGYHLGLSQGTVSRISLSKNYKAYRESIKALSAQMIKERERQKLENPKLRRLQCLQAKRRIRELFKEIKGLLKHL